MVYCSKKKNMAEVDVMQGQPHMQGRDMQGRDMPRTIIDAQPTPPYKKMYRSLEYDTYDEMYANHMRTFRRHEQFDEFTEGLLDEPRIKRHDLLDAIQAYKRTDLQVTRPLNMAFEEGAFNYRPYQTCVIA